MNYQKGLRDFYTQVREVFNEATLLSQDEDKLDYERLDINMANEMWGK